MKVWRTVSCLFAVRKSCPPKEWQRRGWQFPKNGRKKNKNLRGPSTITSASDIRSPPPLATSFLDDPLRDPLRDPLLFRTRWPVSFRRCRRPAQPADYREQVSSGQRPGWGGKDDRIKFCQLEEKRWRFLRRMENGDKKDATRFEASKIWTSPMVLLPG